MSGGQAAGVRSGDRPLLAAGLPERRDAGGGYGVISIETWSLGM